MTRDIAAASATAASATAASLGREAAASDQERLRDAGVRPAFCLEDGLTISIYHRDPDGNFVELQSDDFGDWALSGEWMRTSPAFAANPIGAFFDPEQVYQASQSGTGSTEIRKAIRAGRYAPDTTPDIGLPS